MTIETDQLPVCSSCGVHSSRRKERRLQRLRDIPLAGPVEVLWSKYRWYCEETTCGRLSFFESTPQVPRRARSTSRLRDQLVDAVIRSGRAVSETALLRRVLVDGPRRRHRSVPAEAARRRPTQPADAGH
ncbi:transposase family protein [Pseudarthrobacter sp. R1]|uniref:transposase family protein n=1 Tax=Pseudarthrobacter sp. R1 TaxID=2944934 RepID=UPI00210BE0A0|nr:transposase family protein [Pseudarthrobacter sp. R1]MCQ6272781.1 transposase family protein [Pseudarthrobacter sp. R1]